MNETYFTFINNTGKAIEADEQLYYNYGLRCNQYLITNYGCAQADNKHDSVKLVVRVNRDLEFTATVYLRDLDEIYEGKQL